MKALLILLVFILGGCSNSPLLNHKQEPNPEDSRPTDSQGHCVTTLLPGGDCVGIQWTQGPSSSGASSFDLNLGAAGTDWSNRQLDVNLWMPEHGHGSTPVEISHLGSGYFHIEEAYFLMPGRWEVQISIKQGEQLVQSAKIEVRL